MDFMKDIEMTIRTAIYSSVSSNDQTVSNQLLELKEIARRKGYQIVAEFSDEGIRFSKGSLSCYMRVK